MKAYLVAASLALLLTGCGGGGFYGGTQSVAGIQSMDEDGISVVYLPDFGGLTAAQAMAAEHCNGSYSTSAAGPYETDIDANQRYVTYRCG